MAWRYGWWLWLFPRCSSMLQHDYKGEKQTSYPTKCSLLKHFTGNKTDLKNLSLVILFYFSDYTLFVIWNKLQHTVYSKALLFCQCCLMQPWTLKIVYTNACPLPKKQQLLLFWWLANFTRYDPGTLINGFCSQCKKNVSGYVCNHGSPNGERDTASPRGRYGERPQRDSCLKIHI